MLVIKKTMAAFGKLNPRVENHGDEHVKASDIVVKVLLPVSIMGELLQDKQLYKMLHDKDGRVKVPAASPLYVNRNIEGCKVTIYDNKNSPLNLDGANLKNLSGELMPASQVALSFTLQCRYREGQLERLANLMQETAEIDVFEVQTDMFTEGGAGKKGKGEKKKAGKRKK